MPARLALTIAAMSGSSAWVFDDPSPDWGMWFGTVIILVAIAALIAVIIAAYHWVVNRGA